MGKQRRTPIPAALQARVQFEADRTCCVCRTPGKPIQIHHIDGDPGNNAINNLAVLCRDCHDLTMITGGFNRHLNPDVITLYRDDWITIVAQHRAKSRGSGMVDANISVDLSSAVARLEILKERKQYSLLATEYDRLGNEPLRDKYIEIAIKAGVSPVDELFLRSLQNRPQRVSAERVNELIITQTKNEDWMQLARTYLELGDHKNAISNYCRGIIESLSEGNIFSAAYYLKEMSEANLHAPLFEKTFEQSNREGDLWWALRSLQELGWKSEIREFLARNRNRIEKSDDLLLQKELYRATGEIENFRKLEIEEAEGITSHPQGFLTFHVRNEPENHDRTTVIDARVLQNSIAQMNHVRQCLEL